MDPSLSLTHTFGSERNQGNLVPEKRKIHYPAHLHVELLLLERVQFAVGLVDLQELQEDRFVHVVGNRFPDLFNVLEVSGDGADGGMGQGGEEPLDEFGGFAGLEQVGDHLVDEIGNDVSILVLPLYSEAQLHLSCFGRLAGNGAQGYMSLTLLVGFEGTFEEV